MPKKIVWGQFRESVIAGIEKCFASEGNFTIFRRNFLSHSAERLRRVTLLCCVSENFWSRKSFWIRGRGKYEGFLSKNFCLTVPQKFVLEPFRVSLVSGIERFYASDSYVPIFRRKIFVSQNRKTLQGNLSVLRFGKFPVSHKFLDEKRGSIKFFRRIFFAAQCRKMP